MQRQAIGASALNAGISGGFSVGSLGHAAAFSFYPTKNLGALGDGGAMVSSDTELCRTVRQIANYGSDTRNHYRYLGVNSRLDSIHAAMLSDKLKDLRKQTTGAVSAPPSTDRLSTIRW